MKTPDWERPDWLSKQEAECGKFRAATSEEFDEALADFEAELGKKKSMWMGPYEKVEPTAEEKKEALERGIGATHLGPTKYVVYSNNKEDEEHEIAHIRLGHPTDIPITPRHYVRDEVEAMLYTLKRYGHPKPEQAAIMLNGLIYTLEEEFKLSGEEAEKIVRTVLRRKKAPESWIRALD